MAASRPNIESNIKIAKSLIFNRETSNVVDFLIACRLYIRIKMRNMIVEE